MSNNKMKGLLKGLRYISQIFDNEKEPEMQIGYPTDVKHVAHIGWDGPSVNSPSWMNDFKASPGGFSSAPSDSNGEPKDSITCVSEDSSSRRGSCSRGIDQKDIAELPKASKRNSSTERSGGESPIKEKSDKPKQSRRSSRNATKDLADGKSTRHKDQSQVHDSSSNLPDIPKKTRRKKSKDGSNSKTSRAKAQASDADCGSDSGSISRSLDGELCETASSSFNTFEEDSENRFSGIS